MPEPEVDYEFMRQFQREDGGGWGNDGGGEPRYAPQPLPPVVNRYEQTEEPPIAGPWDGPEGQALRQENAARAAQSLTDNGYDAGRFGREAAQWQQQYAQQQAQQQQPQFGPGGGSPEDRFEQELIRAMRVGTPEQRRSAEHAYMQINLQRVSLTQTERQRMNRMREAIAAIDSDPNLGPPGEQTPDRMRARGLIQHGYDVLTARHTQETVLNQQMQRQAMEEQVKQRGVLMQREAEFFANGAQSRMETLRDERGGVIGYNIPNAHGAPTFVPRSAQSDSTGVQEEMRVFNDNRAAVTHEYDQWHRDFQRWRSRRAEHPGEDEPIAPGWLAAGAARGNGVPAMGSLGPDDITRLREQEINNRTNAHMSRFLRRTGAQGGGQQPQEQRGSDNRMNQIQELRTVATALPENHPALPALQQMEAAVANGNREAAVAILRTLPPEVQSRLVSPEVFRQMNPPQAQMDRPVPQDVTAPAPRVDILAQVNNALRESEDIARSTAGRNSGFPGIPSNPLGAMNDAINPNRRREIERETVNAATLREVRELLSQELTPSRRERLRIAAMSLQPREVRAGAVHPVTAMINDILRR